MWLQAVLAAPQGRTCRAPRRRAHLAAGWDDPADRSTQAPSANTMLALRQTLLGGTVAPGNRQRAAIRPFLACASPGAAGARRRRRRRATTTSDLSRADPGDCIVVDMAVSSEKIALLTELAEEFNGSDLAEVGDRCVFVRPRSVASGIAANLIVDGWPNPRSTASRR